LLAAGVALDAATRGLRVAVIERRDFAAGTSSRSSKLIHGGLRYLEQRDFSLVREALHERRLLLSELAPHLVTPVPFLLPLRRHWEREYLGAGVLLYDVLAGLHNAVPRHRHLGRRAALGLAPGLREDAVVGAITYSDAQVDDARMVIGLLRTAMGHGALAVSGAAVAAVHPRAGGITALEVHDSRSGRSLTVRAGAVVNAAGIWAADLERLAGAPEPLGMRLSKGVHLLVPRSRIRADAALILRTARSVLLVVPWRDHWLIGTTDTEWDLERDHPAATAADVEYLLGEVNRVLADSLTPADVTGVFAGLRPLIDGSADDSARLSREHVVRRAVPGLVTVAGGKYTTYRVMAREAVDAAAEELDVPVADSRTEDVPLVGAAGLPTARARAGSHPAAEGRPDVVEHLLGRYGALALDLLDAVGEDPALGVPLPGADPYLPVEVRYAVTHEGAMELDDILTRRTRISIEVEDRGRAAAPAVAAAVAPLLGWDAGEAQRQVARYHARLDAELAAQAMPDDRTAAAARGRARDPRLLEANG